MTVLDGRSATPTVGMSTLLVLLLVGCATEPVVDSTPSHVGLNIVGEAISLRLADDGSYTATNLDAETEAEGRWEQVVGGDTDGFVQFDGDPARWGAVLPDRLFVGAIPTGTGRLEMTWAPSATADVPVLTMLQQGVWTWIRLRNDGEPVKDYGFMAFDGDRFHLAYRDSANGGPEWQEYGRNQITAADADVSGTWEFGAGDHPQSLVLHGGDGDWVGYGWPGWGFVVRPPDGRGIIAALWAPLAHNQLSIYDGLHRMMEHRLDRTDGTFGPPRPVIFEIFGEDGLVTRFGDAGDVESVTELRTRSQVFNVGNLIWWTLSPEERLMMAQVGDFSFYWSEDTSGPGPPEQREDDDDSAGPGPPGDAPAGTDMLAFGVGAHTR